MSDSHSVSLDWFICDFEYNVLKYEQAPWDQAVLTEEDVNKRLIAFNSVNSSNTTMALSFCYFLNVHHVYKSFSELGWPKEKISHWTLVNLWKNTLTKHRDFVLGTESVTMDHHISHL